MAESAEVAERARELGVIVNRTFELLDSLAQSFTQVVVRSQGALSARDLAAVDPVIDAILDADAVLLGAGVVVKPGSLSDEDRYLQWRQRQTDGSLAPLILDVDSRGDDPYDYPEMEWFRVPGEEGRPMVSGPYFDYQGSERCALTYAVPVVVDGHFRGIVGADQLVSQLESEVLPILRRIPKSAALLNHERRVVTANTPALVTGERLSLAVLEQAQRFPVAGDQGWWLVVLH